MHAFAVPDDGEGIATNAIHARFNHRERNGRGKSCVNGIAAARQHQQASSRRQWLRGTDNIPRQQRHAL
jgi:hypothetical protein